MDFWLVVSTHLKNISQIGSSSPNRVENKKHVWNHHPDFSDGFYFLELQEFKEFPVNFSPPLRLNDNLEIQLTVIPPQKLPTRTQTNAFLSRANPRKRP